MTPHQQQVVHDPPSSYGDCWRTAIASVLDLEPGAVPHFADNGASPEEVNAATREWLAGRGLGLIAIPVIGNDFRQVLSMMGRHNSDEHYIACGVGTAGAGHTLIAQGDSVVHDPSGRGDSVLTAFEHDGHDYFFIYFITAVTDIAAEVESAVQP